jgi:NADH dehydrogenase/NADH:ubiquinone oxidoreductase subunit G
MEWSQLDHNQVDKDLVWSKSSPLLHHPLDCPICDQGGECDLQDQSLFFWFYKGKLYEFKIIFSVKNLGPVVKVIF